MGKVEVMSHNDLMNHGKDCFRSHPDDKFDSVQDLLKDAEESFKILSHYESGAAHFSHYLAMYVDAMSGANEKCLLACNRMYDENKRAGAIIIKQDGEIIYDNTKQHEESQKNLSCLIDSLSARRE